MKYRPLLVVVRVSLGLLFAFSGFTKLMEPYQNFLSVIHSYGILSGAPAVWAAKLIPWTEFIGGLFLALGLWARPATLLLWVLNTGFIFMLSQALLRQLPIDECGCFGEQFKLRPGDMLKLDVLFWFLFGCLWILRKQAASWSLDSWFKKKD